MNNKQLVVLIAWDIVFFTVAAHFLRKLRMP